MFVPSRFTLGKSMVVIGSLLCQLDSLGETRQLLAASSDNLLEATALSALSNKPSWLVSTYALLSLKLCPTQLDPAHYSACTCALLSLNVHTTQLDSLIH